MAEQVYRRARGKEDIRVPVEDLLDCLVIQKLNIRGMDERLFAILNTAHHYTT